MKHRVCNKGEQCLQYKIKQWKKQGSFDILHDKSKIFTLVQLTKTGDTLNNAASIVGNWIFDSNYKPELSLTTESMNVICYSLGG